MNILINYIPIGFQHVVPFGADHLLFIVALFFLNSEIKSAFVQCTVFTVAHSITIALVASKWMSINYNMIEIVVAFSIFIVALENLFVSSVRPWRIVIVFGFGLVHGMGFASALSEIAIPETEFIPAIAGFNLGVEIAQLFVILVCYIGFAKWFAGKIWYKRFFVSGLSLVISGIGLFWSIERLLTHPS